jgi:26S proteasome regulatory subunit N3
MAKTKEGEAAKKAAAEAAAKPPEAPPPPPPTPIEQLRANTELLEKAVRAKETRVLSGRLLRQTAAVRRALDADTLANYVREALPAGLPARGLLLDALSKARTRSQRRQQHRGSCLLAWTAGQEPDRTALALIVR